MKETDEYKLHPLRPSDYDEKYTSNVQEPVARITLSCGCKTQFIGFPSEWDGETRECETCVNYGSLCEKHYFEYDARPAQYLQQTKPTITKLDGKVVAVTMTDDENRVHEILWEAPKPLSDEEIDKLADEYLSDYFNMQETINFVRAIEERHEIK